MQVVININEKFTRRVVAGSGVVVVIVLSAVALFESKEGHAGVNAGMLHRFMNGQTADADEVNANFDTVVKGIGDNSGKIEDAERSMSSLQASLGQLRNDVRGLESLVTVLQNRIAELETCCETDGNGSLTPEQEEIFGHLSIVELNQDARVGGKTIRFSGVNLQIVNGVGRTESSNGRGNLIVGYQESRTEPNSDNFRTGSHSIVIGLKHNFSRFGGIVAGKENEITGSFASVLAGEDNVASGIGASVSGGHDNVASGEFSSILGGGENRAQRLGDTISGGFDNSTRDESRYSTVSGGTANATFDPFTTVSGGRENSASGNWATVSGGCNVRSTNFCSHVAP